MGVARNPRITWFTPASTLRSANRCFDWKYFCEGRPGLNAWIAITWACLCGKLEESGAAPLALWVIAVSQMLYIVDYIAFEPAILSIHDITTERFGFMMAFGDLAFVPFGFSLQAVYLNVTGYDPPVPLLALAVILQVTGFLIFRSANLQKHRFLTEPDRPLPLWPSRRRPRTLRTELGISAGPGGDNVMVDGWWKWSRHPNYFGDFLLAAGWCLSCGVDSIWPHFYVMYFGPTLVHRERRDHYNLIERFGQTWRAYEHVVPYRIVPGMY